MKLAFCTEDPSDEVLLLAFVRRLTGHMIEAHQQRYRIERGGWNKALQLAPIVANAVFNSDALGAVFAIDNDAAEPLHDPSHANVPGCRHCALVSAAAVPDVLLRERPGLPPLRFVFVVPVRTIETWLCLIDQRMSKHEALLVGRLPAERRRLKQLAYGTERPDQELMQRRGLELIEKADLQQLKLASPSFAQFATDVRPLV